MLRGAGEPISEIADYPSTDEMAIKRGAMVISIPIIRRESAKRSHQMLQGVPDHGATTARRPRPSPKVFRRPRKSAEPSGDLTESPVEAFAIVDGTPDSGFPSCVSR